MGYLGDGRRGEPGRVPGCEIHHERRHDEPQGGDGGERGDLRGAAADRRLQPAPRAGHGRDEQRQRPPERQEQRHDEQQQDRLHGPDVEHNRLVDADERHRRDHPEAEAEPAERHDAAGRPVLAAAADRAHARQIGGAEQHDGGQRPGIEGPRAERPADGQRRGPVVTSDERGEHDATLPRVVDGRRRSCRPAPAARPLPGWPLLPARFRRRLTGSEEIAVRNADVLPHMGAPSLSPWLAPDSSAGPSRSPASAAPRPRVPIAGTHPSWAVPAPARWREPARRDPAGAGLPRAARRGRPRRPRHGGLDAWQPAVPALPDPGADPGLTSASRPPGCQR